ncbi:MAG: PQQ-dependent sugar dehydrogenase [Sphingorhabdus sp.]|uniref:PQQ-dependent sugar dehydrogenase n=1 Tax=Sphingorhabdus sp. TaxID=1902408 RepID=UPI003CA66CF3
MLRAIVLTAASLIAVACAPSTSNAEVSTGPKPFAVTEIATFNEPWAMTFLPEFNQALITEKGGKLILWESEGEVVEVKGVPEVAYGGQGGLGDVILHPDFSNNRTIYLSYAEAGEGGFGVAVAKATLGSGVGGPELKDVRVIWRQVPKVSGRGHYGHRLAFSPDAKYLFIASGERQKFDPAQDMNSNLGKILRIFPDGTVPKDNPFYDAANPVKSQIWSLGHRNPLGLTFDNKGQLWNQEMGPRHGDELNLVKRGANYGYPKASNGSHYDGRDIPDHTPGDGFEAPKAFWVPAISPGGLMFYNGDLFPKWKGSLFIGGLGGEALVRVKVNGENVEKADHWPMGARIREVEQSSDGAVWLLEDGETGRLLKLTPTKP